jgi:hypothetical protein
MIRRAGRRVEPYRHRLWTLGHAAESSDPSNKPLPRNHERPVERVAWQSHEDDPYGFQEITASATAAEAPWRLRRELRELPATYRSLSSVMSQRAASGFGPRANSLLVCECIPHLMLTVEQSPNRTVERAAGHRRARRQARRRARRQTERAHSERYAEAARTSRRAATGDASNDTPKRQEAIGQPSGTQRAIHRRDTSEPSGSHRGYIE